MRSCGNVKDDHHCLFVFHSFINHFVQIDSVFPKQHILDLEGRLDTCHLLTLQDLMINSNFSPSLKRWSNYKLGEARFTDSSLSFNYLTKMEHQFKLEPQLKDTDKPIVQSKNAFYEIQCLKRLYFSKIEKLRMQEMKF